MLLKLYSVVVLSSLEDLPEILVLTDDACYGAPQIKVRAKTLNVVCCKVHRVARENLRVRVNTHTHR